MRQSFDLSLYLVTDRSLSRNRQITEIVRQAAEGGVSMVQLREKDASTQDFLQLARELKALLAPMGIPLIINDRMDIALASDADGVHVGQKDMPVKKFDAGWGRMPLSASLLNRERMQRKRTPWILTISG